MIGKGMRSNEVIRSMIKNKAVYFAAVGGAAVVMARAIKKCEIVCYEDLGPEAIYRLYIEKFPAIVAIDIHGNDQYKIGRKNIALYIPITPCSMDLCYTEYLL